MLVSPQTDSNLLPAAEAAEKAGVPVINVNDAVIASAKNYIGNVQKDNGVRAGRCLRRRAAHCNGLTLLNVQAFYQLLATGIIIILAMDGFRRAADLLHRAGQREFYGLGGSAQIARDVAHKFLRIGIRASVFDDTHMMAMSAALLQPSEVVVVAPEFGLKARHCFTTSHEIGNLFAGPFAFFEPRSNSTRDQDKKMLARVSALLAISSCAITASVNSLLQSAQHRSFGCSLWLRTVPTALFFLPLRRF